MPDSFLQSYNRELSYVYQLTAEFAAKFPKIAGRLRLSEESSADPYVSRLLQSFALLSARTRMKIDDGFPEISEALLGVLSPHFQNPIPSAAIVQLSPEGGQPVAGGGQTVPRGSVIESELVDAVPCRFQTCAPVTLWPIELKAAELHGPPFRAPEIRAISATKSVTRLSLKPATSNANLQQAGLQSLRFYLDLPGEAAFELYELICNDTVAVAVVDELDDPHPYVLSPDSINGCGFDADESLYPSATRFMREHELFAEFFAFPQKFLFFEISNLQRALARKPGNDLHVFLYHRRELPRLQRDVTKGTFRLGCTPIINRFSRRSDPIQTDRTGMEHRVLADARRPWGTEVISVEKVTSVNSAGGHTEVLPFYSINHESNDDRAVYYFCRRESAIIDDQQGDADSNVLLSLVDSQFRPAEISSDGIEIELTCSNKNLPERLPFGSNRPHMQFADGGAGYQIHCLTKPTRTRHPKIAGTESWQPLSQLVPNHLSVTGGSNGADAVRDILRQFLVSNSAATGSLINSIVGVSSRQIVAPVRQQQSANMFCRGMETTMEFDEERAIPGGCFLLASMIERFLPLYCSENSFTSFVARTKQRNEIRRWPARSGRRCIL